MEQTKCTFRLTIKEVIQQTTTVEPVGQSRYCCFTKQSVSIISSLGIHDYQS